MSIQNSLQRVDEILTLTNFSNFFCKFKFYTVTDYYDSFFLTNKKINNFKNLTHFFKFIKI